MNVKKLFKLASIFQKYSQNVDAWANQIMVQGFQQAMGRAPTQAELQLAQAIAKLETGYGRSWKGEGSSSHNWGAITTSKGKGFSHKDSAPGTKEHPGTSYTIDFRIYGNDVEGAADVVRQIFKSGRKQHKVTPSRQLPDGPEVNGPNRGELCLKAAAEGDVMTFSAAMYHTFYYGGFGNTFKERIETHAKAVERLVNQIASNTGKAPAVSIKTDNVLPVTTDTAYLDELHKMLAKSGNAPVENPKVTPVQDETPAAQYLTPAKENNDIAGIDNDIAGIDNDIAGIDNDIAGIDNVITELWS